MCEIARMGHGHLDAVTKMEREVFGEDAWSRSMLQAELSGASYQHPLVFCKGNLLVGYAFLWDLGTEAHLNNFAVHPDFRRQGLGQSFLSAIFERFRAAGTMFLEVRESNTAARTLYEKNGFKTVARRKAYYRNGEDALVMKKVF